MKKYFVLVGVSIAALWSSVALALVVPPGFVGTYTSLAGYQTWASSTGNIATAGEALFTAATGGGLNAATKVAPLLADGRAVAMTVNRLASAANVFTAVKALSGPVGISLVLLEAMPAIVNWIDGDGAVHIRANPFSVTGLEKKDAYDMYSQPYGVGWYLTPGAACTAGFAIAWDGWSYSGNVGTQCMGYRMPIYPLATLLFNVTMRPASSSNWMPASMDDIAPYMTSRPPPTSLPDQIIAAGGSIPVTPVSLVVDTPPTAAPPYVHTTTYPKPADQTTRVETLGNPWGLPLNTPTVTRNATSSAAVAAGSSTSSGVNTSGAPINNPVTVMTPTTTVDTSTFDGTKTTTTTVVSQNGAQAQSTTNAVTNVANTTNTSTVNIVNTTTRTVTDTTTGQPLASPTTTTSEKPVAEPPPDLCALHPDILACATLGTPPDPDKLVKNTKELTVVPTAFSGGGGCPSDLGFTVYGNSYAISYQPLCDKLSILKFIFMALAGVAAAYILADSFRIQ